MKTGKKIGLFQKGQNKQTVRSETLQFPKITESLQKKLKEQRNIKIQPEE